ncbi:hypothetical protein K461DRAFT_275350 [Myriangium duriaei CBS 260.36]|uniref:Uncharacterized protein n=1 Tax=Myriangium duriaei CBS 260.36 TaxID=1168546 RepID=A0A9P4J6Z4_9PEZI|nr:hypothetical protein K461DRAFT_275350 [Myriangium duriaei CBS 260.36]
MCFALSQTAFRAAKAHDLITFHNNMSSQELPGMCQTWLTADGLLREHGTSEWLITYGRYYRRYMTFLAQWDRILIGLQDALRDEREVDILWDDDLISQRARLDHEMRQGDALPTEDFSERIVEIVDTLLATWAPVLAAAEEEGVIPKNFPHDTTTNGARRG